MEPIFVYRDAEGDIVIRQDNDPEDLVAFDLIILTPDLARKLAERLLDLTRSSQ